MWLAARMPAEATAPLLLLLPRAATWLSRGGLQSDAVARLRLALKR